MDKHNFICKYKTIQTHTRREWLYCFSITHKVMYAWLYICFPLSFCLFWNYVFLFFFFSELRYDDLVSTRKAFRPSSFFGRIFTLCDDIIFTSIANNDETFSCSFAIYEEHIHIACCLHSMTNDDYIRYIFLFTGKNSRATAREVLLFMHCNLVFAEMRIDGNCSMG